MKRYDITPYLARQAQPLHPARTNGMSAAGAGDDCDPDEPGDGGFIMTLVVGFVFVLAVLGAGTLAYWIVRLFV